MADDIRADVLARYAPEYISAAEYHALNQTNRARQALLDAAQSVINVKFDPPRLDFKVETGEKQQAKFVRDLTDAQRESGQPGSGHRTDLQRAARRRRGPREAHLAALASRV